MPYPRLLPILLFALWTASSAQAQTKPKGEHVVLVIWDGMRPDFVTPEVTPTLHALAKSGTFFAQNHSVYITSTEVNGTAMVTGCYPGRNGILANREYRPEVHLMRPFATEDPRAIAVSDALRGGKYVGIPTIAERVQQAGFRTVIAGTKPVALLHDRSRERSNSHNSVVLFAGKSYPSDFARHVSTLFGKFPDQPPTGTLAPNTAQNAWTTKALVEELWKDGVPKFSTLWLGDPDFTQHLTQPGSPTSLEALRNSDANLATLLAALEAKGVREKTNVFLVSDHGFSTIDRGVDLGKLLREAGFNLVREYKQAPVAGEVLLINLGGSNQLYVPDKDPAVISRLVEFLQRSDFAGPIFTRAGLPGTFSLAQARMDSRDAADIVFSFRWTDAQNRWGTPGSFVAETSRPGYGTHASLSRFDVHNTLIAAGPDIRAGYVNPLPTANVDVAPTILRLLGITPTETLDGRVLEEALLGFKGQSPEPKTRIIETDVKIGEQTWRQYLKFTDFGEHSYLDEGNAGPPPAGKP